MSRIVIDARRMNSSTGHYVAHLVANLEKIDTTNEYIVILLEKEKDFYVPVADNFSVVTTLADHYTVAEQLTFAWLLYRLKPDLVHFSMPQQPLLYIGERVTTIHDTTLIRYENIDQNVLVYKLRKLIFTGLMRNVIQRSKRILTPTEYVRRDIDTWTKGKYTSKLIVTHESGDMINSEPEIIPELVNKRFLFFVGNAFPYKNVGRIIDAYERLKPLYPELELALAGKKDFFYTRLEQDVIQRRVSGIHFLGYISDGQKRWAMQHTEAFVTASLSEGFCIPVIEAMYEGCPVISSDATCLPEVAGDAALYFDPSSTEQLVTSVTRLLNETGLKEVLITKGHENIKRFSWQKMGQETYQTYRSVLDA